MNKATTATSSVATWLANPEGPLKALVDQLAQRKALDLILETTLPASLRAHCCLGEHSGSTLELVVTSAAVATKIRYIAPELLLGLHQAGYLHFVKIACKVRV